MKKKSVDILCEIKYRLVWYMNPAGAIWGHCCLLLILFKGDYLEDFTEKAITVPSGQDVGSLKSSSLQSCVVGWRISGSSGTQENSCKQKTNPLVHCWTLCNGISVAHCGAEWKSIEEQKTWNLRTNFRWISVFIKMLTEVKCANKTHLWIQIPAILRT